MKLFINRSASSPLPSPSLPGGGGGVRWSGVEALGVRALKRETRFRPISSPVLRRDHRLFRRGEEGALLLEVVLALVLFVVAAAIIGGGISASMNSVERQRLNAHASNLAASILAELQMGARTLEEMGPTEFESPFTGWSWEIAPAATAPGEDTAGALRLIEVIVRHDDPVFVYRLNQSIRVGEARNPDIGDFGMDGGF